MPVTSDPGDVTLTKLQPKGELGGLLSRVQDQLLSKMNPVLAALAPVMGQTLLAHVTTLPDPPTGSDETTDFRLAEIFPADPAPPAAPVISAVSNIVPVSSSARGELGDVAADKSYLYVCVGHNLWRRVALSAW